MVRYRDPSILTDCVGDRTERPLWRQRRRVPVVVQLADRDTFKGEFYVDVHKIDGSTAHVVDRLNDPAEHYVPLAVEDRHVFLNKKRIVTLDLARKDAETPLAKGIRALHVRLALSTGRSVEGTLYALLPLTGFRTLDYLNRASETFVTLRDEPRGILVNRMDIVAVTEVIDSDGQKPRECPSPTALGS